MVTSAVLFRVSICFSSTYDQDSELLNILHSHSRSGFFSDMATGRRGSDLSEMSQSVAGLRFNMFFTVSPIFFSVLCVQFEDEQSGNFSLFLESLILPLQYYAVLK